MESTMSSVISTVTPNETYGECRVVNNLNVSDRCSFVVVNPDCRSPIGFIDYATYMYCAFGPEGASSAVGLSVIWLLVLFVGLGITANDFLCPSLFVISKSLRMSQNVAGVTLLAFGSGSPDIFSAVAGIQQGKTDLVIGGLIGGGIFVTTVVVGSIFISQSFSMMKRPFLRDVFFYVVAASWAFYLFYTETIYIYHSIGFVSLYVLYIIVVILSRCIYQKTSKPSKETQGTNGDIELTFKGCSEDDNPETLGVVLTAFFAYRDAWDHERPRRPRLNTAGFDNPVYTIAIPGTNAKEEEAKGNTSGYGDDIVKVPSDANIMKEIIDESISEEEFVEWKEFIYQLCPINIKDWSNQQWWEKLLDILKSPVMLLLNITIPVVDYRSANHNWCRSLNAIHCVLGPMFVVLATGQSLVMVGGKVPLIAVIVLIFVPLALLMFFTTDPQVPPKLHWGFAYLGFIFSVMWIYCIANEIVALLQTVGIVFELSDTILGLTILAWGNCLLDFLSNLAVARKGFPRMGVAACYGAPFLTLLLGVGAPCTIQMLGELNTGAGMKLKFSQLVIILFVTMAVSLLSTLVAMTTFRFQTKRLYGIYLIFLYLTFLIVAMLAETGVILAVMDSPRNATTP